MASSGSVKVQKKWRHHDSDEPMKESPNLEKPSPKKKRLGRAKSPKENVGSSLNNPK
jgi:hypothetical protein